MVEQGRPTTTRWHGGVSRDPNDWPPAALALTLDVGNLTGDQDLPGCGCPTWTVDTLREELGYS
jgi:hypothetical protein